MRILVIAFTIIFFASIAQAKDIQLLNPDFLGKPTSQAIKLLYDKKSDEIAPTIVSAEIKCNKYNASSAFYSETVTFVQARKSLKQVVQEIRKSESIPRIRTRNVENRGKAICHQPHTGRK